MNDLLTALLTLLDTGKVYYMDDDGHYHKIKGHIDGFDDLIIESERM
jgi:hypothetical protein